MNDYLDDNLSLDAAVPSQSNYLTKDDAGEVGLVVRVQGVRIDEMENDHGKTERKPVLIWTDPKIKPMILNQTNKDLIKHYFGAQTVGQLKGLVMVVYNDPTVRFGTRVTGGLRLKPSPHHQPAAQQAPPEPPRGPAGVRLGGQQQPDYPPAGPDYDEPPY